MKRVIIRWMIALLCGVAMPTMAMAQFDLSKAIQGLLGPQTQSDSEQRISPYKLIADAAPELKQITRTWGYEHTEIEYLGASPLAASAIPQIDSFVQAALKNLGIVEGTFSLTLRRNGTGFIVAGKDACDGNYRYDPTSGRLSISTKIDNVAYPASGYIKMKDNKMILMVNALDVADATLLAVPEYRNDQNVLMIYGLLQSFPGVYISLWMHKM